MLIPDLYLESSTSQIRVCKAETNIHLFKVAFMYRRQLISLTQSIARYTSNTVQSGI
jgi:hypothetical protein